MSLEVILRHHQKMSLSKKAIQSVGWMGVANYGGMVFSFLGNVVLIRLLVPEVFGQVALASGLLALVYMISGFGSQEAIVQCRRNDLPLLLPTAIWISIGISISLLLVSSIFGLFLRIYYSSALAEIFFALAIGSCIAAIADAYSAVLRRNFQFRQISIILTASIIISFSIAIFAARIGLGVWSLVLREVTMSIVLIIGFRISSQFRLRLQYSKKSAKWIWDFGWRVMITRLNEVIFGRIDNIAVGTSLGSNLLGHYTQAYRLAILGQQLTQIPIQFVSFSTFSEIQDSPLKLQYGFERINYWLIRATIFLGLVTAFFGESLVVLIYTERWRLSGALFSQLALFLVLTPISENLKVFLIAVGKVNVVMRIRLLQIAVFLPLLAIAISNHSLNGVVWAVNFSVALTTVVLYIKSIDVANPRWLYLLKAPASATVSTIGIMLAFQRLQPHLSSTTWITLGIGTLTFCYLLILIIFEYDSFRLEISHIKNRGKQNNVTD